MLVYADVAELGEHPPAPLLDFFFFFNKAACACRGLGGVEQKQV